MSSPFDPSGFQPNNPYDRRDLQSREDNAAAGTQPAAPVQSGGGSSRRRRQQSSPISAQVDVSPVVPQPTQVNPSTQPQLQTQQQANTIRQQMSTVKRTTQVSNTNLVKKAEIGKNIIVSKLQEEGIPAGAGFVELVGGAVVGFEQGGVSTIVGTFDAFAKGEGDLIKTGKPLIEGAIEYPGTVANRVAEIAVNPTSSNIGSNIGTTAGEIWTSGKIGKQAGKAVNVGLEIIKPTSTINIEATSVTVERMKQPASDVTLIREKAVPTQEKFIDTAQPVKAVVTETAVTGFNKGKVGGVMVEEARSVTKGEAVTTGDTAAVSTTVSTQTSATQRGTVITGRVRKASASDIAYEAKVLRDIGVKNVEALKVGDTIIENPVIDSAVQMGQASKQSAFLKAAKVTDSTFTVEGTGVSSPRGIKTYQLEVKSTGREIAPKGQALPVAQAVKVKPVTNIMVKGIAQRFGRGQQYGTRFKGIVAQSGAGVRRASRVNVKGKSTTLGDITIGNNVRRITQSRQKVTSQEIQGYTDLSGYITEQNKVKIADETVSPKLIGYEPGMIKTVVGDATLGNVRKYRSKLKVQVIMPKAYAKAQIKVSYKKVKPIQKQPKQKLPSNVEPIGKVQQKKPYVDTPNKPRPFEFLRKQEVPEPSPIVEGESATAKTQTAAESSTSASDVIRSVVEGVVESTQSIGRVSTTSGKAATISEPSLNVRAAPPIQSQRPTQTQVQKERNIQQMSPKAQTVNATAQSVPQAVTPITVVDQTQKPGQREAQRVGSVQITGRKMETATASRLSLEPKLPIPPLVEPVNPPRPPMRPIPLPPRPNLPVYGIPRPPKRQKAGLFRVEVRRRGRFMTVGTATTRNEALETGARRVRETAAASFRIRGDKPNNSDNGILGGLSDFYNKGDIFIQKAVKRISSMGERQEITSKGIASSKTKRRFKLW